MGTCDHRRSYVSEIDKIFMIKVKNKKVICIIYYLKHYIAVNCKLYKQ